jgi:hypothetical protein
MTKRATLVISLSVVSLTSVVGRLLAPAKSMAEMTRIVVSDYIDAHTWLTGARTTRMGRS